MAGRSHMQQPIPRCLATSWSLACLPGHSVADSAIGRPHLERKPSTTKRTSSLLGRLRDCQGLTGVSVSDSQDAIWFSHS